jgi:hypothetical protein
MEHAATYRPIDLLWSGLGLFAANGVLYLTNDWPSGSTDVRPSLDLKWPLVYAAATLAFLSLLFVMNRQPPRVLQERGSRHVDHRQVELFFHAAGLVFYGITSVALTRRLADEGWRTAEVVLAIAMVGCAGALIWPILRPISVKKTFLVVAVAGLVLRLAAFWLNPLAVESADMLPLIKSANESLLAGTSPYRLYNLHTWPLPLPYLPGTWLAYLPAVATGLDLRLVNALAELIVLGALALACGNRNALPLGTLVAALIYLSPSIVIFDIYTEHPILWMLIVVLFALLASGRVWAAALMWGVALATSPFALVISPFVALHLARATSPKQWWKLGALAAAPFLALVAPFVVWAPNEFFYGTLTWLNDLDIVGRSSWVVHGHQQLFAIGFAGWFWFLGWERILKPIQAALVLAVLAYYWKRGREADWLLSRASLWAYTLFVCFNIVIWPRHYGPTLCLAALTMIHRFSAQPAAAEHPAAC